LLFIQKAHGTFNSAQRNANKKLRDDIQSLRREKVQQQAVQEKLEKETYLKQSEISKATAATQSAFDARDRANRQIEMMRSQVQEEADDFEAGVQERKVVLDLDRANIRDIPRLRTPKSPTRSAMPSVRSRVGPSDVGGSPGGFSLLSTPDVKLRDETMKNVWLINEKENDLRRQSERLKSAEDGLSKIKKKTGVQDADELAQALLAAEEKNFSLFNLINELNTEMETIEIENNELEQLIESCKGSGTNSDAYRAQLKQELEDQIAKSKQKVAFFELRQNESAEAIDLMKTGALNIYHKVGHSDEAFSQQLSSHGVTEANMLKLLGVIEQRIGELVDIHNIATNAHGLPSSLKPETATDAAHAKSSRDKKGHANGSATGSGAQASLLLSLLRPTPPSADDFEHASDSDGDGDDGLRPCKISELHEKTAAVVGRRKDKDPKPTRPSKK
jgi:coiled-coil domain-containing protein 63/114